MLAIHRTLDHAVPAVQVLGLRGFHAKDAIALQRVEAHCEGAVDRHQLPVPVLRDPQTLAAAVVQFVAG